MDVLDTDLTFAMLDRSATRLSDLPRMLSWSVFFSEIKKNKIFELLSLIFSPSIICCSMRPFCIALLLPMGTDDEDVDDMN